MTVELDDIVRIGEITVAALARREVSGAAGPAISAYGSKWPVAILVRRNGLTTAFETTGACIDLAEFDLRYPGRRAAFERLC